MTVLRSADAEPGEIAVAIHDIDPSTFERCALIRDWLADHGVDRAALFVIPASDLHPLHDRSDDLVRWLIERRGAGDAIAQQGLRNRPPSRMRRGRAASAEFAALNVDETRRAVESGWRILRLAGLEPSGFVAPGYAYTAALHDVLPRRFDWWIGARRLYGSGCPAGGAPLAPAVGARGLGAPWPFPGGLRRSRLGRVGALLRIDLHPEEMGQRRVAALEELLVDASWRRAVTPVEMTSRALSDAA